MVTSCGLEGVRHIHVLGVCGTGMGTFAGMLTQRGYTVTGSDAGAYPPMSTALASWGIPVFEGYRAENLEPAPDLVVVGNVIRRTNPEAVAMRRRGLRHLSFPEAFARAFLEGREPVVVAGTHGKTTTTSCAAHLLHACGRDPGLLVGGLPLDFSHSYRVGTGPIFVVEGDEYDTAYFDKGPKFLHYRPRHVVLTNIEFDHADIYKDLAAVTRSFERLMALVPENGTVTVCGHAALALQVARQAAGAVESYGFEPTHDWHADEVALGPAGASFLLRHRGQDFGRFLCPLYGRHNLLNAVAALALAGRLGLPADPLFEALYRFRGVRKRMEVKGEVAGVVVIDDFAHHPTAVRATLEAVRQRHPGARLWAAFHPESNTSRRRVFQEAYVEAFREADVLVMAEALRKASDPLPPEERLDAEALVAEIAATGVDARGPLPIDDVVALLVSELDAGDVLVGMSGRDFEGLHGRVLEGLLRRSR